MRACDDRGRLDIDPTNLSPLDVQTDMPACVAGGLAWFLWIWDGFGPVLGKNPANATSRGRRVRGKVRAGLPASRAKVPVEPPLAGSPAAPAVKAVEEGGLGFGEFTPLRSPPWGVEKLGSVNMQPLNILIVAPGKR